MKKYIRTKDKVCEITEWQCDLSGEMFLVKADNKFGNDKVFAEDIVAEADTIEELCDEFVLVDENYCHDFYIDHYYDDMVEVYEEEKERCKNPFPYPRKPRIFYGAIWTDKGLIYVAKMNEKGELELL